MNKKSYDRLNPQTHKRKKAGAESVRIYTDGACENNQQKINKGGWGFVTVCDGKIKRVDFGGESSTSNQRIGLLAEFMSTRLLHV